MGKVNITCGICMYFRNNICHLNFWKLFHFSIVVGILRCGLCTMARNGKFIHVNCDWGVT
ncbi:hypothetical protein Lalb_Chr09g0331631 [Lupinus albus]|uniref:Uncharacterized protein n=1 Tax=Lupinus albus TaxID=3870 RepID=A0A6A4Q191_LUPAL|nr:hypothetical protein Lalb_Chr09g0331631 [Lupinus albus]